MPVTPAETAANFADQNTALKLRKTTEQIERLVIFTDAKAIVVDLAKLTVTLAGMVLKIGAKILSVVLEIIKQFPNTPFGVVISVCLGLRIRSIQNTGRLLVPVLMPRLVAFGLGNGAIAGWANAGWSSAGLTGCSRNLAAKLRKVSG